ncbi:MAG: PAS domain-containing protein [Deltaproteobacteria bacterium]|nr:PAS domain-containing protein [Deltaproteobacteria bacterium]
MTRADSGHSPAEKAELARLKNELKEGKRLQKALFELTREISLAKSEDQVIKVFAETIKELFPRAFFCIKVVDPETIELVNLYAEGHLKAESRDTIEVKRSAVERFGLQDALSRNPAARIRNRYRLVFDNSSSGTAVPLVANGKFLGLLALEYKPGEENLNRDRPVLRQVANQLALSLHHAHSVEETLFLKNYLEQLIESANALIIVTDPYRKVRVCNKAVERLLDMDRKEILDKDFLDLLPEDERSRLLRVFVSALHGKSTTNLETRLVAKKKELKRVNFNTSPLLNADGQVEGLIAVGQDLSQIRNLEQQMLHVARLAGLGETAAQMIHDMNTPLTSITVYSTHLLKKLEKGPIDKQEKERVLRIRESAERILDMTRNVMSFARTDKDIHEAVDLNKLISKSITLCDPIIEKGNVRIHSQLAQDLPLVKAISGEITQAFLNLLMNACQAVSGKPNPLIVITSNRLDEGFVEILISDNGCGIPEEEQVKIFDPFYTSKPDGEGTGLGLSIVKTVMAHHYGSISVDSEEGQGTTFILRFPFSKKDN